MKRKLEMLVPALMLSAALVVGVAAVAVAASSPSVTTGASLARERHGRGAHRDDQP